MLLLLLLFALALRLRAEPTENEPQVEACRQGDSKHGRLRRSLTAVTRPGEAGAALCSATQLKFAAPEFISSTTTA
jgi:hypothetical protein